MMILVPYDRSAGARAAIEHAGSLMPGAEAMVLTIWDPGFADLTGSAAAMVCAREGATRASAAGLIAHPMTTALHGDVARTVLTTADHLRSEVVVMGSRDCGPAVTPRAGSVAQAVMQHSAGRDVVVVSGASS
jgi:nucleotide-binding universal stress UspA family protein